MSYHAFLTVLTQLAGHRKARVVVDDQVIFFEPCKRKNHLTIYAKVYSGDRYLPQTVRACVSSCGMLRWQQGGAYLKLDEETHSVSLIQEMKMEENKYLPFREYLKDFSSIAAEWTEILNKFAEGDHTFNHAS